MSVETCGTGRGSRGPPCGLRPPLPAGRPSREDETMTLVPTGDPDTGQRPDTSSLHTETNGCFSRTRAVEV